MLNFEGNWGTMTILGNREDKKTYFRFFGNRGTSQFISGGQVNRYPAWEDLITPRSLVMPDCNHRGRFFDQYLTLMKDSYSLVAVGVFW